MRHRRGDIFTYDLSGLVSEMSTSSITVNVKHSTHSALYIESDILNYSMHNSTSTQNHTQSE